MRKKKRAVNGDRSFFMMRRVGVFDKYFFSGQKNIRTIRKPA